MRYIKYIFLIFHGIINIQSAISFTRYYYKIFYHGDIRMALIKLTVLMNHFVEKIKVSEAFKNI